MGMVEDFTVCDLGEEVRGLRVVVCRYCGRRGLGMSMIVEERGRERRLNRVIHSGRADEEYGEILVAIEVCDQPRELLRMQA